MARSVLIVAESASGKSTSIEYLDPKETFLINVANKDLPYPGWELDYKLWSNEDPSGNMYVQDKANKIITAMRYVSAKRPEIKTIVVDDWQFVSSFEFFDRAEEKGYDRFNEIGAKVKDMATEPITLRQDLMVIFLTHAENGQDLEGDRRVKAKTIGRMVDDKLTLEALFTVVLFGKVKKNQDGTVRHVFMTKTEGSDTCKSPREMFATAEIPNDLQLVRDTILEYATRPNTRRATRPVSTPAADAPVEKAAAEKAPVEKEKAPAKNQAVAQL